MNLFYNHIFEAFTQKKSFVFQESPKPFEHMQSPEACWVLVDSLLQEYESQGVTLKAIWNEVAYVTDYEVFKGEYDGDKLMNYFMRIDQDDVRTYFERVVTLTFPKKELKDLQAEVNSEKSLGVEIIPQSTDTYEVLKGYLHGKKPFYQAHPEVNEAYLIGEQPEDKAGSVALHYERAHGHWVLRFADINPFHTGYMPTVVAGREFLELGAVKTVMVYIDKDQMEALSETRPMADALQNKSLEEVQAFIGEIADIEKDEWATYYGSTGEIPEHRESEPYNENHKEVLQKKYLSFTKFGHPKGLSYDINAHIDYQTKTSLTIPYGKNETYTFGPDFSAINSVIECFQNGDMNFLTEMYSDIEPKKLPDNINDYLFDWENSTIDTKIEPHPYRDLENYPQERKTVTHLNIKLGKAKQRPNIAEAPAYFAQKMKDNEAVLAHEFFEVDIAPNCAFVVLDKYGDPLVMYDKRTIHTGYLKPQIKKIMKEKLYGDLKLVELGLTEPPKGRKTPYIRTLVYQQID